MTLNLTIPSQSYNDFSPRITVIGVGGGGTNAVDNMIAMNLQGVEFVVANTDAQQLVHSRADRRIQLGPHLTQGLGAGAKPDVGRAAAEEAADELYRHLEGAHMVFITAGMGGGTGTGAAPVIARMAREKGILTVGVVTKPFTFEGGRRARSAEDGIAELQHYVDTLIVIPNQNLFRLANERTGFKEAFKMADNVLYMGVRGVTDLMMSPGLVNLDFNDIRAVMAEMGKAMMGTGESEGENRAMLAAERAISNPLLEDTSMSGARALLINITGGEDMTLFEVDQAVNRIREEVDEDANIIFGASTDDTLEGRIRVSVVATGIESAAARAEERPRLVAVGGGGVVNAVAGQNVPGQGAPPVTAAPAQTVQPLSVVGGATALRPSLPAQRPAGEDGEPALATAGPVIDNAPIPPRTIPLHLQQPLRPQGVRPVRPSARPATGLFADGPRAEVPPSPPRKTLFGIVTGVFRAGAGPVPAGEAPGPSAAPPHHPAQVEAPQIAEPAPAPEPAAHDAHDLEIPTFLRRQNSTLGGAKDR